MGRPKIERRSALSEPIAAAHESEPEDERRTRADAIASREAILTAAAALVGDRRMSMGEIAAAAGVGRSTLYRHFPNRKALQEELADRAGANPTDVPSRRIAGLPYQTPGHLGRSHLPLEVTHVLDEVPPHLVPDQLVAEARRAGAVPVGLYVVDIDGSQLVRLAGTEDFPVHLGAPPALGPEIVPEGLPAYTRRLASELPGCVVEPLWLRGRITGLFVSIGQPVTPLEDIAKQGAAALELANDYTDVIEAARRRKPPTPAAEIQQNLLPPRIARITGAQLAGSLLPTYEVGGDWFDFVENRDGSWLAIADASGNGSTAAGLGAATLGALRSARRSGFDLVEALQLMDETVRRHQNDTLYVTTLLARWRAATATFTWINCGHPNAYLADADGSLTEMEGPIHPPLGSGSATRDYTPSESRLSSGQRVILVTDGITERRTDSGTFGVDGVRNAIQDTSTPTTAAATVMAILHAITNCWKDQLDDDATVVCLCID